LGGGKTGVTDREEESGRQNQSHQKKVPKWGERSTQRKGKSRREKTQPAEGAACARCKQNRELRGVVGTKSDGRHIQGWGREEQEESKWPSEEAKEETKYPKTIRK